MKRLFTKGFIYIGFFIPLFFMVFFISLQKPNYFIYDQYQDEIFEIKKIQLGIYGDSHIKNAIDTRLIRAKSNRSITHFSSNGVPLFYSIRQIERHLKLNTQIKVILDLGTNNIENSLYLEGDQYSKVGFLTHLSNNYIYLQPSDYHLFFKNYPVLTLQGILNGIYQLSTFFNAGINKTTGVLSHSVLNQYDQLKQEHDSVRSRIAPKFNSNFEIENLKELVRKHPKTSFLFIRPPEHPLYQSLYGNQTKFKQLKDYFKSKPNVLFLDYGNKIYADTLFNDYSHLNNQGNFLFTNALLESEDFVSFIEEQ